MPIGNGAIETKEPLQSTPPGTDSYPRMRVQLLVKCLAYEYVYLNKLLLLLSLES